MFEFFSAGDLPPDIQKEIDKQNMALTETKLGVDRFFLELNLDQLRMLRLILASMARDSSYVHFIAGLIGGHMQFRYNVCANCGVDHEAEAMAVISKDVQIDEPIAAGPSEQSLLADMEKYRLVLVDSVLQCRDCGMRYSSIADRMLRKPDYCEGCFIKEGHG